MFQVLLLLLLAERGIWCMAKLEKTMKAPGRNQAILIIGGAIVLGAGFVAAFLMPEENLQPFLDFAGSFGKWVLGFASGFGAVVKATRSIAEARNGD